MCMLPQSGKRRDLFSRKGKKSARWGRGRCSYKGNNSTGKTARNTLLGAAIKRRRQKADASVGQGLYGPRQGVCTFPEGNEQASRRRSGASDLHYRETASATDGRQMPGAVPSTSRNRESELAEQTPRKRRQSLELFLCVSIHNISPFGYYRSFGMISVQYHENQ